MGKLGMLEGIRDNVCQFIGLYFQNFMNFILILSTVFLHLLLFFKEEASSFSSKTIMYNRVSSDKESWMELASEIPAGWNTIK